MNEETFRQMVKATLETYLGLEIEDMRIEAEGEGLNRKIEIRALLKDGEIFEFSLKTRMI